MKNQWFKKEIICVCIFAMVAGLSACQSSASKNDSKDVAKEENKDKFDTKTQEKDAQFVVDAVAGNYKEIELSQLALQKSMSADVKKIAQQMIDDHTALLNQLKNLATQKSISIPANDSTGIRKDWDDLNSRKVSDFDEAWVNMMIDGHKSTLDKFQDEQKNTTDPDIKSIVDGAIPKIQMHLDMLNQCQDKLKKS